MKKINQKLEDYLNIEIDKRLKNARIEIDYYSRYF